ncbi:threonine-phosphate decarboxylase CobD [Sneathiella marina]|uniref:threonine-phosphate decarboxylase n=1 Tax=Sneathiella marina TaxID=2950108 RepID=A0ABY4W537_9PROT|nr:threonine-phosphate decarboxylase CobD [Sneathiella marina]USG62308.1 threonine-phosphate decarboxylase CobD [Sneathiella marina]
MAAQRRSTTYNRSLFHGGDLQWAQSYFSQAKGPWLDLSTGINPRAYPIPAISPEAWQRLPGGGEEQSMLAAAKKFYGASRSAKICAVPGTQLSIQMIPRLYARSQVDILSPTYAEHAASWKQAGHQVREISCLKEISEKARFVIVVHPNNPDGKTFEKSKLVALSNRLRSRNGQLIIDEAFADTNQDCSLVSEISQDGPLILKSFGKFFGLAGLRLGFCLGPATTIDDLRQSLGPWAVSGVAMEIATKALQDDIWISQTRRSLNTASEQLETLLREFGFNIIGRSSLFCCVQIDSSDKLFEYLCERGIYCRMFPERPGFLRFGLPNTEEDWQRFTAALCGWQKMAQTHLSD